MASPFQTSKKAVDLAAPAVRVSRIRRDPPPPVKVVTAGEIKDRDARNVVIGIIAFSLILFVTLMGVSNVAGWSFSRYIAQVQQQGTERR